MGQDSITPGESVPTKPAQPLAGQSASTSSASTSTLNDKIRELNKKRGTVKGRLTLFQKFLASFDDSEPSDRQLLEIRLRRKSAEAFMAEFSRCQDALEHILSDAELNQQLLIRESFEDSYYTALAQADMLLARNNKETRDVAGCSASSSIKLPTISLPTFDGAYDGWLEFRDTFLSMIHNSSNLDNVQKFHYLRSALTGSALQVIKALEFSAANYVIAWELLENRYNNTNLLIHNHVKALFSMHAITKESPSHIRKLIDSVLKNLRTLKSLGEPTESWDTLIIYTIVSKLDASTEKEWEQHKLSVSKTKFSLQDLIEFLKHKADMLEMIKANNSPSSFPKSPQDQSKKPAPKTVSFVVTKNSGKFSKRTRVCKMCNQNHSLYS